MDSMILYTDSIAAALQIYWNNVSRRLNAISKGGIAYADG